MEVSLASQTQYVPQVRFPQMDPVTRTIMLIIRPIGEIALEIVNAEWDLNTRPIILLIPIVENISKDSQAAGTWINIILKETPW